jgi:hypothetical protein
MKTFKSLSVTFIIVLVLTAIVSCEKSELFGIKGEGPEVKETLELPVTKGLILEIPATVYLKQGEEQSMVIEAQQNIIDNIERSNKYGALKLKFDRNVVKSKPITIYMTVANIDKIDISGSGELFSDTKFITDGYLSINISGSGKVHLNADADEVDLNISGSGEIYLAGICNKLEGDISGSGEISLESGNASYANLNVSGSGDIYAFNYLIEECYINTAGSGDSRVNVSDKLNVKIAGSGDVYYKGHPSVILSIAGSGSVINNN